MTDKNTPGPWVVRVRRYGAGQYKPGEIADCFVQSPDVHGFAYEGEVLGDDEYREYDGVQRKLADCKLIAMAIDMRAALRTTEAELVSLLPRLSGAYAANVTALLAVVRAALTDRPTV